MLFTKLMFKVLRTAARLKEISTNSVSIQKLMVRRETRAPSLNGPTIQRLGIRVPPPPRLINNFQMITEFVLISFNKPDVCKTLNIKATLLCVVIIL